MTGHWGNRSKRSQQFLLLSALLTLLLAVAAVAVAMSHYCRSRYDLVAILKTLGAGRAQLRKLIIGQWLMVLGAFRRHGRRDWVYCLKTYCWCC
ncbi:sugar ABC transporter permease [Salmonella enterica subsp. enterica]|uniref:Sugar ABC transporter permease n=1 Tax=Salmonella enterica I TaxID=59201 RepID=A0A447U8E3_SALET|nr:sugar ABC transporter permease [Salmonella enterica subsp. enterica]